MKPTCAKDCCRSGGPLYLRALYNFHNGRGWLLVSRLNLRMTLLSGLHKSSRLRLLLNSQDGLRERCLNIWTGGTHRPTGASKDWNMLHGSF